MADLLQQVVLEIQKLPRDQRDAIATRILADLKDEQAWTERFEATTDDQWGAFVSSVHLSHDINMIRQPFDQFITRNIP